MVKHLKVLNIYINLKNQLVMIKSLAGIIVPIYSDLSILSCDGCDQSKLTMQIYYIYRYIYINVSGLSIKIEVEGINKKVEGGFGVLPQWRLRGQSPRIRGSWGSKAPAEIEFHKF